MGLNAKQIDEIVAQYIQRDRIETIAERFHVTPSTIRYHVKRRGVPKRIPLSNRIYTVNHDFFNKLDHERAAYWYGFLLADGGLRGNVITIELHQRDRSHLSKLIVDLEATYRITDTHKSCCAVHISSEGIKNAIFTHGLTENKSKTTVFPIVDSRMERHVLRGLIDGDGWITQRRNGVFELGFCSGSKEMIEFYQHWLNSFAGRKAGHFVHRQKPNQSCYQVVVGGRILVGQILDYLYTDSVVFLDRKKALADTAILSANSRPNMNPYTRRHY